MTHAEACEAAREECYASVLAARRTEASKSLRESLDETHARFARRSGRTKRVTSIARSVRLEGHADADLEKMHRYVRQLTPIPVPSSDAPSTWVDTAHSHPWGAPPRGPQVLPRTWMNGNCFRLGVASILGRSPEAVPDPETFGWTKDWLDRYSAQLAKQTGYRLEKLPASCCPPRNNRVWIATIREDGDADHTVVCRNNYVVHDPSADRDPSGGYHGPLPMDRLVDGLLVVAASRVVPVFSPHRGGYQVVPA